jgi:hypothetical protein
MNYVTYIHIHKGGQGMGPCRPCTWPMELELAISELSRLRLLTNRKRQLDPFQCLHRHILVPGSDDKHDTGIRQRVEAAFALLFFCVERPQPNKGRKEGRNVVTGGMELPTHRDLGTLRTRAKSRDHGICESPNESVQRPSQPRGVHCTSCLRITCVHDPF